MTIEQRSPNSWRIKQLIEGQWVRVNVDHKPSKKEALELLAEAMRTGEHTEKGSFEAACNKYIKLRENVLSPRTIREYKQTVFRFPEWFKIAPVQKLSSVDVQRVVNELAANKGPKTVKNYYGLITAVLKMARPGLVLRTTLPKIQKKEDPYLPDQEALRAVLNEAKQTPYYIPLKLACYGLRRGEICALELSDLDDNNVIHVTKDIVEDINGNWVVKPPKTPKSFRRVPIGKKLADEIREQGYIYKGCPGQISKFLKRTEKKLGLESFSLHKLRHLFASLMFTSGVDLLTLQDLGGWEGDDTLVKVYLQTTRLQKEEERRKLLSIISQFIDSE